MSRVRAFSSPELEFPASSSPASNTEDKPQEDAGLECVATNIKLLLKLVQDHNEASMRHQDNWKTQRVTTMMTILDDLKSRIQKAQQSPGKKELRRCFTDLKPIHQSKSPRKPPSEAPLPPDDIQKLRKELNTCLTARKSLQMMCSSMGKEKEIMAKELARKAQELSEMEELIGDIRAQNEKLSQKVQACAAEHKEKKGDAQASGALHDRNRELSEQLLRSIEGYRSLKRRYKDVKEENSVMRQVLKDLAEDVKAGAETLHELHDKITRTSEETNSMNIEEEVLALEGLFQELGIVISNNGQK